MRRVVVAALFLSLAVTAALARRHAWVGGAGMGPFGSAFVGQVGAGGPPPVPCQGTGLNFTQACNSQYLAVF